MRDRRQSTMLGPAVFSVALVGVLVFFWWLLIHGHGGVAAH